MRNGDLVKFGRTCFRVAEPNLSMEDKKLPMYSSELHLGGLNTTKPEPPEQSIDVSICSGVENSVQDEMTTK